MVSFVHPGRNSLVSFGSGVFCPTFTYNGLSGQCFSILGNRFICFAVAIFDLVHDCGGFIPPSLNANNIAKSFLKYE